MQQAIGSENKERHEELQTLIMQKNTKCWSKTEPLKNVNSDVSGCDFSSEKILGGLKLKDAKVTEVYRGL